ncbi:hypothetical protein UPYG_G00335750 [Umbra pygmaea]|uniref:Uncharacterized protein n=1 Tax=Umbra pygmaea TaxID=75934 RepID=A0ABD0WEI3_UMBPY
MKLAELPNPLLFCSVHIYPSVHIIIHSKQLLLLLQISNTQSFLCGYRTLGIQRIYTCQTLSERCTEGLGYMQASVQSSSSEAAV